MLKMMHPILLFLFQLAARWRLISDADKEVYFEKERHDRERFHLASKPAEPERLEVQEARGQALVVQTGDDQALIHS